MTCIYYDDGTYVRFHFVLLALNRLDYWDHQVSSEEVYCCGFQNHRNHQNHLVLLDQVVSAVADFFQID